MIIINSNNSKTIFLDCIYLNMLLSELVDDTASVEVFSVSSSPKNDHNDRFIRFTDLCTKLSNLDAD